MWTVNDGVRETREKEKREEHLFESDWKEIVSSSLENAKREEKKHCLACSLKCFPPAERKHCTITWPDFLNPHAIKERQLCCNMTTINSSPVEFSYPWRLCTYFGCIYFLFFIIPNNCLLILITFKSLGTQCVSHNAFQCYFFPAGKGFFCSFCIHPSFLIMEQIQKLDSA